MAKDLFKKYLWLVETISTAGRISLREINEKWKEKEFSGGLDINRRTFINHLNAIQELWGINIECEKSGDYRYYITNRDDMEHDKLRSWLINTFTVSNVLNDIKGMYERVLLEDIPSGQMYLTPIVEAMRGGNKLQITYQSYWHDTPSTFELKPYCLKVFKQLWYVVGYASNHKEVRTYSLDRIKSLEILKSKFTMPKNFDAYTYFKDSYGIIANNSSGVQTLKLKVTGKRRKYITALPLHKSQTVVEEAEDYMILSYRMYLTYDLIQELLSLGADVEVLEPEYFRGEVSEEVMKMYDLYNQK